MPLRSRRKGRYIDVPVMDLVLRVAGTPSLYEEARAAGMHFYEQLEAYSVRHPGFQSSKVPLEVSADAPPIVREMAHRSAVAGIGPMFTFRGALTEFVGLWLAKGLPEVSVSCGGDQFVITRRPSRLAVPMPRAGPNETRSFAVVIRPELGPHGIYTAGSDDQLAEGDAMVVVSSSLILAHAASVAAVAILSKPRSFRTALSYLQDL